MVAFMTLNNRQNIFSINYLSRNLSSICIPTKYMCDGVKDCEDGSDEIECSCSKDEFQCSRRLEGGNIYDNLYQCNSKNLTNNGEDDCLTRKDEDE